VTEVSPMTAVSPPSIDSRITSFARAGRRRGVLPGIGSSMGLTIGYLSLLVLIPLSTLLVKSMDLTWTELLGIVTEPRVHASYTLCFGASLIAASVNLVFGVVLAWVLMRYRFPGRKFIDGLIDLPFALPTAVAGIALAGLFAPNGLLGAPLDQWWGIKVAY